MKHGLGEANPIMRKVFSKFGLYGGLALMKIPLTLAVINEVVQDRAGLTFMFLLVIPFIALLINNLYWIYKHHGT